MGRKKDPNRKQNVAYQRPWCFYCDREFDADGILLQHQKARHFQCRVPNCGKRCSTITSLVGHTWHVHHTELSKVPNAIEGRDDTPKNGGYDIVGMMGIPTYVPPPSVRREREAREAEEMRLAEEALREEEEAAAAKAAQLAAAQAALAAKSEAAAASAATENRTAGGATKRPAPAAAWGGGFAIGGGGGAGGGLSGLGGAKKAKRTGSGLFSPRPSVASAFDSHSLASDDPANEQPAAAAVAEGVDGAAAVEQTHAVAAAAAAGEGASESVNAPERPPQTLLGVVKVYDRQKGFGFITPSGETSLPEDTPTEDIYVHRSGLITHGVGELEQGRTVTFTVQVQEDGRKQCVGVRDRHGKPVDDALLRRQKAAAKHAASDRVPLNYGTDTFVGRKNDNEDRATSVGGAEDKDLHPGTVFELDLGKWFGVYDGHCGQECAEYVMSKLHVHTTEAWQQQGRPTYRATDNGEAAAAAAAGGGGGGGSGSGGSSAAAAAVGRERAALDSVIEEGFRRTEDSFAAIAQQKDYDAGSTALVCLVHGRDPPVDPQKAAAKDKASGSGSGGSSSSRRKASDGSLTLVTANLGDCRAVLCRGGEALRLSDDHKPNRRDEKARIEKAGGYVVDINGIHRVCTAASKAGLKLVEDDDSLFLAVSRSFGDRKLKSPSSTKTSMPLVSAVPEITSVPIIWEDLFFVIACDGIWDVLSDQQVVNIAATTLAAADHSAAAAAGGSAAGGPAACCEAAAAAVVREAYNHTSLDNLTATVVQFGWHNGQDIAAIMASKEKEKKAAAKKKKKEIAEEEIDMFG